MRLKLQYLTDEKGDKSAVQIPIKEWIIFMREVEKYRKYTNFYKGIENAMKEVYNIEKGNKKPQSLSEFLNAC
jgi:hypothetical protein